MRLSYMENTFWYGCALRVAGVPAGALYAAVRMMQWADFRHGFAVSYFEAQRPAFCADGTKIRLIGETEIDGNGQSSLIVGPPLLDRATVLAEEKGHATVLAENVSDLGWLGQLAALATKRGLAAILSFSAEDRDAQILSGIYSADRTIAGLPGSDAPWWIEADRTDAFADIVDTDPAHAVSLTCVDPARHPDFPDKVRAAATDAGIPVSSPAEVAAADREKMRHGFEVDEAEWRSLAAYGFDVLAQSTERSLHSAGA